jgi:hypothetical protein
MVGAKWGDEKNVAEDFGWLSKGADALHSI